jgi:hypothetical protein
MFQLWRHKLYLHCSWIFDSESIAY